MPQLRRPATRKAPTIHQSFARSCCAIPSSTAYLERYGGASAVAVATRSATAERMVRVLYGRVSRRSIPRRRRVPCQDQSSTCAPRSRIRCPPGCQTLTPTSDLPTAPDRGSRRRLQCFLAQLLFSDARLDGVRELPLEQAVLIDVAVHGARPE